MTYSDVMIWARLALLVSSGTVGKNQISACELRRLRVSRLKLAKNKLATEARRTPRTYSKLSEVCWTSSWTAIADLRCKLVGRNGFAIGSHYPYGSLIQRPAAG